MVDLKKANDRLEELLDCVDHPRKVREGQRLYCGLDLGTAFIVLVVLDEDGNPVDCKYQFASVVKDGMVVDYVGACDIARRLKEQIEGELGVELEECAVAIRTWPRARAWSALRSLTNPLPRTFSSAPPTARSSTSVAERPASPSSRTAKSWSASTSRPEGRTSRSCLPARRG